MIKIHFLTLTVIILRFISRDFCNKNRPTTFPIIRQKAAEKRVFRKTQKPNYYSPFLAKFVIAHFGVCTEKDILQSGACQTAEMIFTRSRYALI